MKNLSRTALIVLIIGVLCLLFAPYLLSRPGRISFTETGEIGDTIGGITAPITGLIGSILVFLALRAQIVANEIIQGQIKDQKKEEEMRKEVSHISDLYKYFLGSIDTFTHGKSKSVGAIMEIMNTTADWERENAHKDDQFLAQGRIAELYGILKLSKLFLTQLNKSKVESSDKDYFKELIKHHLDSYISPYLEKETTQPQCKTCNDNHNGVSLKIKDLVKEIYLLI